MVPRVGTYNSRQNESLDNYYHRTQSCGLDDLTMHAALCHCEEYLLACSQRRFIGQSFRKIISMSYVYTSSSAYLELRPQPRRRG